jgi:hypothetical protein
MKKASTGKKPGQKKPAAKKSAAKSRRMAGGQAELAATVARLGDIAEQLAQTAERLALLNMPVAPPFLAANPGGEARLHIDEHADDVEVSAGGRDE